MSNPLDIEKTESGVEHLSKRERLLQELAEVESEIAAYDNELRDIHALRHELFTVIEDFQTNEIDEETGEFVKNQRVMFKEGDGLYDDPTYNTHLYTSGIGLRKGGTLEYKDINESYADKETDTPEIRERNFKYRQQILKSAQALGFVSKHAGVSDNESDRYYTIQESTLEPIEEPVEAVIIAGAAGKSNVVRAAEAVRDIASGAINTNKIILAGCNRPSNGTEMGSVAPFGTFAGDNEVESMMFALRDVIAQDSRCLTIEGFDLDNPRLHEVPFGKELVATTWSGKVLIGGNEIEVIAVEAPFDPERVEREGGLARATTEETFLASLAFLSDDPEEAEKTVVMVTHDGWKRAQEEAAKTTIGLEGNKKIITAAPDYDDRLLVTERGVDIRAAEQVVDEIQKTLRNKMKRRTAILNKLSAYDLAA